jgi:hypothetical protein|tara:strand:+ start:588 stop:992 length:405 start_codon:yes stop_codon:yes gene_type:complete
MSKQEFHVSRRFAAEGSKIIMVDIDETISRYASGCKRTYDMAKPIPEAIAVVNDLYDQGHHIIMWTARGSSEESKLAGRCYYDFTINQLQKWGVKFNELSTGTRGNYLKPPVDIVIDDKAVTMDSLIVAKKVLK